MFFNWHTNKSKSFSFFLSIHPSIHPSVYDLQIRILCVILSSVVIGIYLDAQVFHICAGRACVCVCVCVCVCECEWLCPIYSIYLVIFKVMLLVQLLSHFSRVQLCNPIDGSTSGSLSVGFSRHEHWSGLPFPSPVNESESEVAQSCRTLSDPMDHSLPGSSVHGIFQARVLEWGAIVFSKVEV